jgi:hypothetical protein
LAAPPSYASPPSAAASPASSTVDRRGIERAAEPSRQRAGDQESAATEPVRDAESDVAPLAAGEPPVTEAQMLAGIEAFRAQLAELQQQPDYAS